MLVFCHFFLWAAIGLVFARATGDKQLLAVWLFPLLGPFAPGNYPDYFLGGLLVDIGSPSE